MSNSKSLWLFGTYKWQGNPKALFLYMSKNYSNTHECWWIADTKEAYEALTYQGFSNITYLDSNKASNLFSKAKVYVTENFRENYPKEMAKDIVIFNTWHGVGLKHIELALGEQSVLSNGVVKKYIKNFDLYKNNTYFLATSKSMEEHFLEETVIKEENIIRGCYPRNIVYNKNTATYDITEVIHTDISKVNNVILFAPTYRITAIDGVFQYLLPNLELIKEKISKENNIFIIKVHPFMTKDVYFQQMREKYKNDKHIIFWNDDYDIYEIFNLIDTAIIDYSSIFYDLLEAGVKQFIRYIPDYNEYIEHSEFIGDYYALTTGEIAGSFTELLAILGKQTLESQNLAYIQDYFFGYDKEGDVNSLICKIDSLTIEHKEYKELHSFDIFDTLVRRKSLTPFSIFYYMQTEMLNGKVQGISNYLIDNWVKIRSQVEHDIRDAYAKTQFERNTDKLEITLDAIYQQLQKHLNLTFQQIEIIKQLEIDAEIAHIEPISERVERALSLHEEGHRIVLISDMYLPKEVIESMLAKADPRLLGFDLYLSSEIGHQKSTGKIYKNIFFSQKYEYSRWVHYGDNIKADGTVPRQFGIQTQVHHPDSFINFESAMIEAMSNRTRYYGYLLATKLHRFRTQLIKNCENNIEFDRNYYAYAYAGTALVPYVHWSILDAIHRGYQTLYFISRDGHFLKQIADQIITIRGYNIKTAFIYGSRQAWRVPSYIDELDAEMFGQFGNFVGMDSFDDLVKASWISAQELLELFPQFEALKSLPHLRGATAENIRNILKNSPEYHQKVLKIAAERRQLVCQYLQENINFNERFAFVEFWGRGYTQDVFARLLKETAHKDVDTDFYYVRSFSPDKPHIHRHNFILAPKNFSYFEPIFASTPYQSIKEYYFDNKINKVQAVINPSPNKISTIFENQFENFINDYLGIVKADDLQFIYELAGFSYDYQMKNHSDQFICSVFAALEDNISSYGETREYAPAITLKQLQRVTSKQDLDKLTSSIAISLARSREEVYRYYQSIYIKMKLPKVSSGLSKRIYAVNDLSNYIYSDNVPFKAYCIKNNAIYFDVSFHDGTKNNAFFLKEGDVFDVIAVEWLKNGVPRLATKYGYLTAHKDWVAFYGIQPTKKNKLSYKKQKAKYSSKIIQSEKYTEESLENNSEAGKANYSDQNRKWNKFRRNPYLFFNDSKKSTFRIFRHLFNEKYIIGKTLSDWIRKYC